MDRIVGDSDLWAEPFEMPIDTAVEVVPKEGRRKLTNPISSTLEPWWGRFVAWGEQEVGEAHGRPNTTPALLQPNLDASFLMAVLRSL